MEKIILITLEDQGGAVMNWNYNELSPTLRAEMKQHLPVIVLEEEHESSDNVRNEIC